MSDRFFMKQPKLFMDAPSDDEGGWVAEVDILSGMRSVLNDLRRPLKPAWPYFSRALAIDE